MYCCDVPQLTIGWFLLRTSPCLLSPRSSLMVGQRKNTSILFLGTFLTTAPATGVSIRQGKPLFSGDCPVGAVVTSSMTPHIIATQRVLSVPRKYRIQVERADGHRTCVDQQQQTAQALKYALHSLRANRVVPCSVTGRLRQFFPFWLLVVHIIADTTSQFML